MMSEFYDRRGVHFKTYNSDQQEQHLPHLNHNQSHDQNHNAQHDHHTRPTLMPFSRKQRKRTSVLAWCMVVVCTVLLMVVILLGLAVLIVYLVYRPRSPQFDIAAASLNAGYLDTGNLLNADISLLVSVVNPNTKVNIYFSYLQMDMYFQGIMIGTQIIDAFYEPRGMMALRNLHVITSAVPLPLQVAQEWGNGTQAGGGGVTLHLSGRLKTRWLFGRWLRYTNRRNLACNILVGPPPNGVLLRKKC